MNIYDMIEVCHLDKEYLTPEIRKHIITAYDLDQWIKLAKLFLKGLDKQNTMAGRDVQRLYDYIEYYRERDRLTWEQKWHLVAIIIENWNQMSCEARANLLI